MKLIHQTANTISPRLRALQRAIFNWYLPNFADFYIGECQYCGRKYYEAIAGTGLRFYRYCPSHRTQYYRDRTLEGHTALAGYPERPGRKGR